MKISIETDVNAPLSDVWKSWVTPDDIRCWNFAIDSWHCPSAEIDLKAGGKFSYRMEAKDGSMGFDYEGEIIAVDPTRSIHFKLADDREVVVEFHEAGNGIKVVETFEAEDENSAEQQRQGWLGILNNFKRHVEGKYG